MNADPARLHDPQLAFDRTGFSHREKIPQPVEKKTERGSRRYVQYDNPGGSTGRKTKNFPEVSIKRDENASLGGANFEKRRVLCALKALFTNGRYVVSRRF